MTNRDPHDPEFDPAADQEEPPSGDPNMELAFLISLFWLGVACGWLARGILP